MVMAKPDDRSDNAAKLQEMARNTEENISEANDYLAAHAGEISAKERADIEAKNERRAESAEGFRSEIEDETSQ
ncbi:small acid-soluble spore protein Tlp [Brevibacillus parabrevis]|nr:small acid-soluble spore protein Tlp [Brevibacillus parabrevis]MED1724482.1 small acid-soluble spore protein Tlp [Brevibacillus parabrevis]